MYIELTLAFGCINNCVYCPQKTLFSSLKREHIPVRPKLMTFDFFKKIINKIPKKMDVIFSGLSEVFQNPDCTKMILYAHNKGHRIILYTTLMGTSPKNINLIIKKVFLNNPKNRITLHLPSKEKLENIKVTKEYLEILEKIINSEIKVNYHHHGKNLHHQVKELLRLYKIKSEYINPHSRAENLKDKNISSSKYKKGHLYCLRHQQHAYVVLPEGTTILCCMDYGLKHILGNIATQSYQSIHQSFTNELISKGMQNESLDILCRNCFDARYADERSKYINSDFSFSKIKWGIKLFIKDKF